MDRVCSDHGDTRLDCRYRGRGRRAVLVWHHPL